MYLVKHKTLSVFRIAKVISKADENYKDILYKANLIRNLRHSNIPQIIDIEENEERIILIKEYVDGITLSEYVQRRKLKDKEIAIIACEICNILEYMHNEMKLLHMDLKPDNIMIDNNDKVWLIDLGSTVRQDIAIRVNVGSPTYAAPEQYLNEVATIQSDVYGVGEVLAYMCRSRGTKDNQAFDSIIQKCIKHEPKQRYKSIKKVSIELKKILAEVEKEQETSKIFFIRGSRPGIGVTHICLCLAKWISGYTSVKVYDCSTNNHLRTEGLKGYLGDDGSLIVENISIIPNVNNTIQIEDDSKIKIVDCSGLTWQEIVSIRSEMIRRFNDVNLMIYDCMVVGGKHGIYDEMLILNEANNKNCILFANLMGGRDFYEYTRIMPEKEIYRFPCVYEWKDSVKIFDKVLVDFKNEYIGSCLNEGKVKELRNYGLFKFAKKLFGKA